MWAEGEGQEGQTETTPRERERQRCDLCFSQFAILITFSLLGGSVKSIPAAYAFYPLYSSSVGETKAACTSLLA